MEFRVSSFLNVVLQLYFEIFLMDCAPKETLALGSVVSSKMYHEFEFVELQTEEFSCSCISSATLTLSHLFEVEKTVWANNVVLLNKIRSFGELKDFLRVASIHRIQHGFTALIGLLSPNITFPSKTLLYELPKLEISSSVYFCSTTENIDEGCSIDLLDDAKHCFETYHFKGSIFTNIIKYDLNELVFGKMRRRSNLQGLLITAGVYEYSVSLGFNSFTRHANNSNFVDLENGFEVEVFFCLRQLLNFTYSALLAVGFLAEGSNNSVLNFGLAQPLNDGTTDLVISFAEYVPYRMRGKYGIRYLHASYRSPIHAFFVQPRPNVINVLYVTTFDWKLWLGLIIFIILICLFIWIFPFIIESYQQPIRSNLTVSERIHLLSKYFNTDVLLWMVSVIGQRSYSNGDESKVSKHAAGYSIRIILLTTMFAAQVHYVGYTSSMFSMISLPTPPVRDFEDLKKVSFDMYLDKHVPSIRNRFNTWMQQKILLPPHFASAKDITKVEGIPKVISSQSAMVTTTDEFFSAFRRLSYTDDEICGKKVFQVPVERSSILGGMFVKQGSPIREYLNAKLLLIRERGLEKRNQVKYFRLSTIQCMEKSQAVFTSVGFQEAGAGLFWILAAFPVSWIVLVLEYWTNFRWKKRPLIQW